ncbi:hypothetical protein B566_EDAN007040 [Ephemera danica]|nr:hypothetical protein B566_EDAN007040 [Ephemera danica]
MLVFRGKLYVANVGDSRALLCRTDADGVLRVVQLSVDHDLHNEDELLRIQQLGLDIDKIRQGKFLLLMSDGLYKSLEEATGTDQVNQDIARFTVEQVSCTPTLSGHKY